MRQHIPASANLVPDSAQRVFEGIIYDVYHWEQEQFDGSYATFEMLKRPDTAQIIALDGDQIVYIHLEQPGMKPQYDLVAGRNDVESEDELTCAKREMLEEAGMKFKEWKLIHTQQSFPKIDHIIYTFLADTLESTQAPSLDPGEKIEVMRGSFREVKKLALADDSRYFAREVFEAVDSIEDLRAMPSLHDYS